MPAGLFSGITGDRKLMRGAQVKMAARRFVGCRFDESLADHSGLTRIRQRWGAGRFGRIFKRAAASCAAAGLVSAETVHVDATLIRADVCWKGLACGHVERVLEGDGRGEFPGSQSRRSTVRRIRMRRWRPRTGIILRSRPAGSKSAARPAGKRLWPGQAAESRS